MEHFAKIVDGYKPLTDLTKRSILDVWHGPEYVLLCKVLQQGDFLFQNLVLSVTEDSNVVEKKKEMGMETKL